MEKKFLPAALVRFYCVSTFFGDFLLFTVQLQTLNKQLTWGKTSKFNKGHYRVGQSGSTTPEIRTSRVCGSRELRTKQNVQGRSSRYLEINCLIFQQSTNCRLVQNVCKLLSHLDGKIQPHLEQFLWFGPLPYFFQIIENYISLFRWLRSIYFFMRWEERLDKLMQKIFDFTLLA